MSDTAPEDSEDFAGKYETTNPISRRLIDGYFEAVQRLLAAVIPTLPVDATVHEIGCAEGNSTKRLARLLPASASFSASELIDDQVRVARKANPNVDIIQADVYDMPHADRSFDLIFLLEVLEHTPDPELALRNIRRLVAPGGWLIVGVPREPIWRILNLSATGQVI